MTRRTTHEHAPEPTEEEKEIASRYYNSFAYPMAVKVKEAETAERERLTAENNPYVMNNKMKEPWKGWEIEDRVQIKSGSHGTSSEGIIEGKRAVVLPGQSSKKIEGQPYDQRITITANNPSRFESIGKSTNVHVGFKVKDITSIEYLDNETGKLEEMVESPGNIKENFKVQYPIFNNPENDLYSMFLERFEYKINDLWTPGVQTYK